MTQSSPRGGTRADAGALSAAFSRAVDLSALSRPAAAPPGSAPTSSSPFVVDVTEANFPQEVGERSMRQLVLVDLWATWCEPCKQLSPLLERLVAEYGGAVMLAKVDVDANPRIGQAFGAQSIPMVVAIAGGRPVDAFTGALPEAQVRAWLTALVQVVREQMPDLMASTGGSEPPPPDPLLEAAEAALESGDLDAAIAAYENYAAAHPADTEAKLAVAQLTLQRDAVAIPSDAIAHADAAPDDAALQVEASTLQFANGDIEAALDRVLAGFARQRELGDDAAAGALKAQLLTLFDLLGHDDPLVGRYRRRLAALLY